MNLTLTYAFVGLSAMGGIALVTGAIGFMPEPEVEATISCPATNSKGQPYIGYVSSQSDNKAVRLSCVYASARVI